MLWNVLVEGIRVYEGNIFRLKQHIDRLYESAQSLMLEIPMTHEEATQATILSFSWKSLSNLGSPFV